MKWIKTSVVIILVVMFFAITNVTFAYNDYCYETEDGRHDYTFTKDMAVRHPHSGFRKCFCGERVDLERQYSDECKICRNELCEEGIHYYLCQVVFLDKDGYTGYGECECGKRKYFSFEEERIEDEPYEGFITFFGRLHLIRHPHYEYDIQRNRYDRESTLHVGSCGVCQLEDDYDDDVEEYEIDTLIYGRARTEEYMGQYDEQYDDYYEDDSGYWDEYNEDYDDNSDYEEEDDDDLYEWLEMVKDILD